MDVYSLSFTLGAKGTLESSPGILARVEVHGLTNRRQHCSVMAVEIPYGTRSTSVGNKGGHQKERASDRDTRSPSSVKRR